MYCDLHMHSTASDGTNLPEDLPGLARSAGLAAIALTDHDTTAGLEDCGRAAAALGIGFLTGVEISADPTELLTEWGRRARDSGVGGDGDARPAPRRKGTLHILGYGIDPACAALQETLVSLREARQQRNPRIVANLQELGVQIDMDEVTALAREVGQGWVVGRPHIAQVLVRKGYAKSIQDAFHRYIGEGKPAYARKDFLPPAQAIQAIHAARGLAVLAHPVQLGCGDDDDRLVDLVKCLRDRGIDGLEVFHHDHAPADVRRFAHLADRLHLLASGGSDFHGDHKAIRLGSQQVPLEIFTRLREACDKRQPQA
jgi:3',5'-nucleoside bisphosphate phosphatase